MVFVRWHYRDGVYVRSHYRRSRRMPVTGQATLAYRLIDGVSCGPPARADGRFAARPQRAPTPRARPGAQLETGLRSPQDQLGAPGSGPGSLPVAHAASRAR
jgi:hypothetical protein